jgi:hypothetical protein
VIGGALGVGGSSAAAPEEKAGFWVHRCDIRETDVAHAVSAHMRRAMSVNVRRGD